MKIGEASMYIRNVFLALALLVGVGAHADPIKLSFDSIFPATPYKDALGSCMQLLSCLDQLCHERERGEEMSIALVHDAFIGKLVQAQHKITHLTQSIDKGALVADDNLHYLSTVLGYITQLYQQRLEADQRTALATSMLESISAQLLSYTE